VRLRPGGAAGEDDVRAHARERLAAFKVPRRIRIVDEFPRTGSGTVRRGELP
jgi:acyl-CoA synthetase (AMP-forming)/AMP-acid ligase II